jgi:hypothetical protein
VTRQIIEEAHNIGLTVRACVSDMGPSNQDLWKHIGIVSNRSELVSFIDHPFVAGTRLHFLADPPHLLKNIRNCLLTQTISLPESTVVSNNLPSNTVSLQHVKDLIKMQENSELKIAPKLKAVHVNPGQYQKMKVSIAAQVFSHSTATALTLCVSQKLLPDAASTTAWFLQAVNDWFDALNARFRLASLFSSSASKISHLDMIINLFHQLHFGGRDAWKPIQSGVRLSTQSILGLFEDLVVNGPYQYLMTGRMTQDCVENFFSQVRSRGDAHPTPRHLRHCIRLISISQYMYVPSNSSYERDADTYFLDFLKVQSGSNSSRTKADDDTEEEEFMARECNALLPLSSLEGNALYLMAGWAVFKEMKKTPKCAPCHTCIKGDRQNAPPLSELTTIKSFSSGAGLTHPSSAILDAVIAAESLFQANKDVLVVVPDIHVFLMKAFTSQFSLTGFPPCHNVVQSIVARYLRLRVHMLGSKLTNEVRSAVAIQHGSKSALCRTKIK